jgi:hypothetical protein
MAQEQDRLAHLVHRSNQIRNHKLRDSNKTEISFATHCSERGRAEIWPGMTVLAGDRQRARYVTKWELDPGLRQNGGRPTQTKRPTARAEESKPQGGKAWPCGMQTEDQKTAEGSA